MANYKGKINVTLFNAVKICLESGNSVAQTAKFMKLSCDVVAMIRDAENLDEYRALMTIKCNKAKQARAAKRAAQAVKQVVKQAAEEKPQGVDPGNAVPQAQEVRQVVTVQATRFMEEQMKRQTELLTVISQKLAAIIDDLYGTGTKAGE